MVARGLTNHAELFPDIPIAGRQLFDTQRSADGWKYLGNMFLYLAGQCHKTSPLHQSEAIQESVKVLRHVQTERDGAYPQMDAKKHFLREMALVEAYALVSGYYKDLKKTKEKKKKQRKEAQDKARQQAGLPPEPPKPPKTKRQRAGDAPDPGGPPAGPVPRGAAGGPPAPRPAPQPEGTTAPPALDADQLFQALRIESS